MQVQIAHQQSMIEAGSLGQSSRIDLDTPLPSFKKFTYNDSQIYRESVDQLWNDIYQYPSNMGFFPKRQPTEESSCASERRSVPSAREAWSIYDPQKQYIPEFPVFRSIFHKQQAAEILIKGEQLPKEEKKGWGQIYSQPFWGSSFGRPPPFMGAFDHVQPDFSGSLNVSVPSVSEYNPYSCYLQPSRIQIQNPYQKQGQDSKMLASELLASKGESKGEKEKDKRYYFEIQSVESKEKSEIQIEDFKESRIEQKEDVMDKSVAWSYQALFGQRSKFKCKDPAWQSQEDQFVDGIVNSRVFQVSKQTNSQVLQSLQSHVNLSADVSTVLPDSFILSEISKMLQSVECQLFVLDYDTLTWSLQLLSYRPQFFLRNSMMGVVGTVLEMASQRSRLQAALTFLRKGKYRKVYSQLGNQIAEFLVIFEQIVLELSEECTLVEFLQKADKLACQIKLLYGLLINEEYIKEEGKLYGDIDFRFLHSEALIFKRIIKLARNADAITLQTNSLVVKLLQAAFKPLLILLDKLLFEECQYLELNADLYLRYYFANPKVIVDSVGKKLHLIKQESNELYLICKVKENFQLLHSIKELDRYERRWERSFSRKRKLIERIRRQFRQKVKWQRERRKEEKMREIYELKNKIYQNQQDELSRFRDGQNRNREQLERLRNEIDERKEKRRLIEEIEKEREKNLLLDIELKEKQKLAKEKQKLMDRLERESGVAERSSLSVKIEPKMDIQGKKKDQSELSISSQENINDVSKRQADQLQKMDLQLEEIKPEHQSAIKPVIPQIIDPKAHKQPYLASKIISQGQKPHSHQVILSRQSIEDLQQRYVQTAEAFKSFKRRKEGRSREASYFRIVSQPEQQKIQNESGSDKSIQLQQPADPDSSSSQSSSLEGESEVQVERSIDIHTCLQICVDQIVRKQSELIQSCLRFIILDKYQILSIIQFLRETFMSGNGEKVSQFIRLSIGAGSLIGLRHFSKCLLFDTAREQVQRLSPAFYHTKGDIRHSEVNIFEDNLEYYIGFEFQSLPSILEPYFSYIHLSKYMQIFGFIVRLRHCQNLVSDGWLLLNGFKRELERRGRMGHRVQQEVRFLSRLCVVRYKISNFLRIFQNYLFFRVIEKEYKKFRTHFAELQDLEQNHLKMLDNIIRYGFIDNPNQNISKTFKQILSYISQFHNIVIRFTLDDISANSWQQVEVRLGVINSTFVQELKDIEVLLFKLS